MELAYVYIIQKEGKVVGVQSWFYESLVEAMKKAETYFKPYNADLVTMYYFDEGCKEFVKEIGITNKRNDIRWKDVFNCRNVFPADFSKCKEIAKQVGYKYILFNGSVYSVNGTIDEELCTEEDLIV